MISFAIVCFLSGLIVLSCLLKPNEFVENEKVSFITIIVIDFIAVFLLFIVAIIKGIV